MRCNTEPCSDSLFLPFLYDGPLSQIDGAIVSYPRGVSYLTPLIMISHVAGLVISGSGSLDGGGAAIWNRTSHRPYLLELWYCPGVVVTGITLK